MKTSKEEREKYLNDPKFAELCFRAMDNICSFHERKGLKQDYYYKAYRTRNIRDLSIKEINGLIFIYTFFDKKKGFHEEWRIGKRGKAAKQLENRNNPKNIQNNSNDYYQSADYMKFCEERKKKYNELIEKGAIRGGEVEKISRNKEEFFNNYYSEGDKLEADNFYKDIYSKIKINKDILLKDNQNNKGRGDWWGTNFYHSSDFNSFSENIKSGKGFKKNLLYFFKYVILKNSDFPSFLKKWYCYANIYNPKDSFGQNIGFYNFYADLVEEIIFPDIVISFSDVNKLSGQDYEQYCGKILNDMGWKVQLTNKTNDQGVDIIGKFEDKVCCFQCKRYSNPVGNKAVQEIFAGKAFYNGTHAIVVSNAGFTKSAETLASSLGVILISDNELKNLEFRIF